MCVGFFFCMIKFISIMLKLSETFMLLIPIYTHNCNLILLVLESHVHLISSLHIYFTGVFSFSFSVSLLKLGV